MQELVQLPGEGSRSLYVALAHFSCSLATPEPRIMDISFIRHFKPAGLSRMYSCLSGFSGIDSSNRCHPSLTVDYTNDCVIFIPDNISDAFCLPARGTMTLWCREKLPYAVQQHHNSAYITVIPPELIWDTLSSREASHQSVSSTFLRTCSVFMECGVTVKLTARWLCFAAPQKLPSVCSLHHKDFLAACEGTFLPMSGKRTANTQTHAF